DEELRMLVRRGTIDKRTPLQAEGHSDWAPAEQLLPNVFDTPPPAEGASTPVKYEEVFPGITKVRNRSISRAAGLGNSMPF
ncbi:MAG: hypothetical protein U9Q79_05525, partial [Candidatus Hydrogenedentes bacterium]|nr:hypothetical protein [Candidatus Hydrogenedentota bacterium]